MKSVITSVFFSLLAGVLYSQSIAIESGAEIIVGTNADLCATNWGNISGNITGGGKQCGGALPVELISFHASKVENRNVSLTWSTAIEINNSGFELERKNTGEAWSKVAWIEGFGNSSIERKYSYTDMKLTQGIYTYRLKQIDYNGNYEYFLLNSYIEVKSPFEFGLSQNFPNPSNPASTIEYQVPVPSKITIKVFDIEGKEVAELVNKNQEAGYYSVKFEGTNLASGIYFYVFRTDKVSFTKKMILVK